MKQTLESLVKGRRRCKAVMNGITSANLSGKRTERYVPKALVYPHSSEGVFLSALRKEILPFFARKELSKIEGPIREKV